jgi:predicted HicB family RNase H-like nuclease
MNQTIMQSYSESPEQEMTKAKLQILIDADLKKTIAKLAIDKETSVTNLVEQALIKEYGKLGDRTKGEKS